MADVDSHDARRLGSGWAAARRGLPGLTSPPFGRATYGKANILPHSRGARLRRRLVCHDDSWHLLLRAREGRRHFNAYLTADDSSLRESIGLCATGHCRVEADHLPR
jgi:hypothetical protein